MAPRGGALEPRFWAQVCELAGVEAHVDAGWSTGDEHARDALAEVIRSRTRAEWEERFAALDACVEPVVSLSEALEEPVFLGRGAVVPVGGAPVVVPPTSRGAIDTSRVAPKLGAHTRAALREAGCGAEQIEAWIAEGSAASVD